MSLIDQDVWQEFSGDLPVHYSISFYDPIQKKSIKLDQEVLDGDGNPFRLNRNEIVDNMGGVRQNVHLYINDDASALPGTSQPQSSVENIDSHYSHAGLQQRHQGSKILLATFIYIRKPNSFLSLAQ